MNTVYRNTKKIVVCFAFNNIFVYLGAPDKLVLSTLAAV